MSRFRPLCMWLLATVPMLLPQASAAQQSNSGETCQQAAAMAERQYNLPHGMLLAIGRVESGMQATSGEPPQPWPWSVNADGVGSVAATRRQAIRLVQSLQQRGARDIDIGCFQVSVHYHPNAFASLQDGFDPFSNARFAGRFLASLHRKYGDWSAAIMAYHTASAASGAAYRRRVLRAWADDPPRRDVQPEQQQAGLAVYLPHKRGTAATVIRLVAIKVNTPIIITPNS